MHHMGRLKWLIEKKSMITCMEAHTGLTGLIAEKTVIMEEGAIRQFDGMWVSSLEIFNGVLLLRDFCTKKRIFLQAGFIFYDDRGDTHPFQTAYGIDKICRRTDLL